MRKRFLSEDKIASWKMIDEWVTGEGWRGGV